MDTPPFSELGLPPALLSGVEALGFERPSPIQALAIPPALEGKDLLGLSSTGSGKTAAFGLPLLEKLDEGNRKPQGMVICPTRELAVQVCEEIHRLAAHLKDFRAIPVYGGAPIDRQLRQLKQGVQVVVGTPGRLLDHLRRRSLDVRQVKTVVLDEADRMLDMGFREEMEELLAEMPEDRQSLFFSATMSKGVARLVEKFSRDVETIEVKQKTKTVSTVEQCCYEVRQRSKVEVLSRLLDMEPARLAIVFCNTKRSVDEATEALLARGYTADRLHGDISQAMRERTLRRFREGTIELLVATDVAARGLDVDDVDAVYNYDLPQDPEDYVHRIGRTGRAGRSGRAVSFVFGRDLHRLETIERYTKQPIKRERIPTQEMVEGKMADRLFDEVAERLTKNEFESHESQIDRLLEQGHTPTDIVGAVFTMLREERGREFGEIQEDRPGKRRERQPRDRDDRRSRDRDDRRSDRGERRPHRADDDPGMVALFFSLGKVHGVKVGEVIGMLYRESGVPDGAIGSMRMHAKYSRVQVAKEHAGQLVKALKGKQYHKKKFILDFDRGPKGE